MGLTSGEKENFFIRFLLSRKIRLISALALALALIVFPAKTQARVPANVPPPIKIAEKSSSSFLSRVLSHIVISGGSYSTFKTFVNEWVQYTGTNPEREFQNTEPWHSSYQGWFAEAGLRIGPISIKVGQSRAQFTPEIQRFFLENPTRPGYDVKITLPTVDMLWEAAYLKVEFQLFREKTLVPFIAAAFPISQSMKTLDYNSSPLVERELPLNPKFQDFDIENFNNMEIPVKLSYTVEGGFGLRLWKRFRVRVWVRYAPYEWDIFYYHYRHDPISVGAGAGIY